MERMSLCLLVLLSISGVVRGEESASPGTVTVVHHATPAHQVVYAWGLAEKARMLEDERERVKGLAAAALNLLVIPRQWPDDREAVVAAHLRAADLYIEMRAYENAAQELDRAEESVNADEFPLVVRRRLEISTVRGREEEGRQFAKWLNRRRIEEVARGQETPIYLAVVGFYENVGDHRRAGIRAEEYARHELRGSAAAAVRIRAARSFAAAKERASVERLVADARQDLLSVGREEAANGHLAILAMHEELDNLANE